MPAFEVNLNIWLYCLAAGLSKQAEAYKHKKQNKQSWFQIFIVCVIKGFGEMSPIPNENQPIWRTINSLQVFWQSNSRQKLLHSHSANAVKGFKHNVTFPNINTEYLFKSVLYSLCFSFKAYFRVNMTKSQRPPAWRKSPCKLSLRIQHFISFVCFVRWRV